MSGRSVPAVDIPLYIKEHPIPVRKPKITEVLTASDGGRFETSFAGAFYGNAEPLTVQISGWLITPFISKHWTPTVDGTSTGTPLGLTDFTYADIIAAYTEGNMQRDGSGLGHRIDPYEYIDPYGNVYTSPKIMTYEFSLTPIPKKQMMNIQLWLET